MALPALCLEPIEAMSSKEAQLSARHVAHRSQSHFESILKSSTWVLKNALASESSRPVRELHVRFSRAYASYRLHEYSKALADFSHCIEIEPAWHLAHYNRACTYYKMGKLDEAVQDITKAIKYDSKNKIYLESRATLLRALGRFKEAIEDYNRIEDVNANDNGNDERSVVATPPAQLQRRASSVGKLILDDDGLHPSLSRLLRTLPSERTTFDLLNVLPVVKTWRFFHEQSEKAMMDFLMAGALETYIPRHPVFRQGDEANTFYILMSGSVSVSVNVFEHGTLKSKKVCTLLPGDGFGEPREVQGPRRATVTALGKVHCLAVSHVVYEEALRDHMKFVYEEKCQVLRQCRVFESCSDETIERIAQLSSVLLFEPFRTLLKAGELVDKLFVIKRGVCYVTKSLPRDALRKTKKKPNYDGSWVLDNGWQLTNPRLRNDFHEAMGHLPTTDCIDVTVATLTTGQVFGEVCVLRHNQLSTVSVTSTTMVEVLELSQDGLAQLNLKFNSRTMNALQDSFLFHNPPPPKIAQLMRERAKWDLDKTKIIRDVLDRHPTQTRRHSHK
ncbi:hypothetical protein Ae201684P_019613 [Aphanomyces euteiches]|nr:hypothetical protein Ae201684P_019613 [Aphanomyces euteiches]